ncbi:MAG: HipA family kinase [Daejeonella sp.]
MPLPSTATFTFLEEIGTDGHSPLKFICEDDHIYYCKYRTGRSLNQHEIDCLFYEVVSNRLLKGLNIPTPELSLIEISANSFNPKDLKYHKRFCKPGVIYLGSKHIENTDLVQSVQPVTSKREFKQLMNPYDLIKIAMFDLWVDNCDRGREENYNLLLSTDGKSKKIYAFDHAFCFGGLDKLRMFHAGLPTNHGNKLITSLYFKKILPFLDKKKCKEIVDNFLFLQPDEAEPIILDTYNDCPQEWGIPFALVERMISLLTNTERNQTVIQSILSVINH